MAAIAHLAATGAIALVPVRAALAPRVVAPFDPVDLALDDEEPTAHDEPSGAAPALAATPVARSPMAALGPALRPGGATSPMTGDAPGATSPSTGDVAGDPGGEPWRFDVARPTFDATARGLVKPSPTAPNDAPPKSGSTTGGVTEALDARDRALGLSRGGEVLSAMEDVARHGDAPIRGGATFDVVVDARGSVAVSLVDASEGHEAWARQVAAMRDAVGRRHVRLPPGAKGLKITVRLESRVTYVDGRDPRKNGTHVVTQGLAVEETKTQIRFKLPSVTVGVVGKVCGAGVHVGLDGVSLGGGCSPENIGSPIVRVVSGRVLGEARL